MNRPVVPLTAALLLASLPAAAADYVSDPLTSASHAGRGSQGGTFTSEGWVTTGETDSVWYEIPEALESGAIEYSVKGLQVGGSLSGADHDLLTVYQAPDVDEPVPYSPHFRNNDMKVFTRIFGSGEASRGGAMKLEAHVCVQGPPWYHDSCPAGCATADAIAYAHGSATDVGWNPAAWYRMRLSWGGGTMSFARDGQVLGTASYEGIFAPQPLRVRIGSARHGASQGAAMPVGLTFRDVVIQGTPGGRSPVCGQIPPDAGTPPPDAGAVLPGSEAIQDVTAASWVSGVFPDPNDLNVEGDATGNPGAVVYLRFPALGGAPASALLRLRSGSTSSSAGGSGRPCRVADDSWSETTLTWANRPAVSSECAGAERSIDSDQAVEWDVTSLVVGSGTVNLALVSHDGNGAHYLSREASAALGPRLLVAGPIIPPDAGQPAPDAGPLPADAASPPDAEAADAGAGADAAGASGRDASAIAPVDAGDESAIEATTGCGCAAGPGGALSLGLGLSLLALVARRERRG